MIWTIAAGVVIGLSPVIFLAAGFYTILAKDPHDPTGDNNWQAGIMFACALGVAALIFLKAVRP